LPAKIEKAGAKPEVKGGTLRGGDLDEGEAEATMVKGAKGDIETIKGKAL
jgi:hypothetical protein